MAHILMIIAIVFSFCYLTPKATNVFSVTKKTKNYNYSEESGPSEHLLSGAEMIHQQIQLLKPKLNSKLSKKYANSVFKSSNKYQIDPQIMIAIIMTESSFNQNAISTTGDISISQINYDVWQIESQRMGFELSKEKLLLSSDYAIDRMGLILSIMKDKFAQSDSLWYGRYHSSTPYYKQIYLEKVHKHMSKFLIAQSSSF